jgi:VWFA-related protein
MPTQSPISLIGALVLVASVAAQDPVASRQAQVPPGSKQQPTAPAVSYDVDVPLVEVDAVVTDEQGHVIRDLRADEFQVLEDGTPQTIDRVSFVEIPIERGQGRGTDTSTPAADVHTNQHRFDGRLYVLLLDDLHTATSRSDRVKVAARRFIQENLDPTDLAAVVYVSGTSSAGQGFTSDRQLLLDSVARFSGRKLRSETLNLIDKYNEQLQLTGRTPDPERIRDPEEPARADDARVAFDSIARIARQVGPVRGRRKALIWFGEGLPYDMFDATGQRQASLVLESARSAVAAAGRANLAIYGIDARGLAGMGEETMQLNAAPDPAANLDATRLARELARSQDNLRQIASDTGGFAVVNTSAFARAFARVVEDNSAYYLLGYYPKNAKGEGAYRSLEVRVTRPGASVRARRGYTLRRTSTAAASGSDLPGVPATLQEALASPVPRSGLPMAVHAAAFKGTGAKASVLVTIEYAASAFVGRPQAVAGDDRLLVSVVALDTDGKVQASDHATVDLRVKPDTQRAMTVLGFRTHARLELAPGRYQLRAGGVITGSELVGSVHTEIEVPDFSARGLQMSGLELTCVVAAYTPTAHVDERMRSVLPAPPTTMRDFRNDDTLAVFAGIYDTGADAEKNVTVTTTVRRPDGQVVMKRSEARTNRELKQAQGGYSIQVPLGSLAPGDYVLRLEAATAGAQTAGRDMALHVWAVPASATPAAAAGSASDPSPATGSPSPPGSPVGVVEGAISGVAELREVVARNEEEWQQLWRTLPFKRAAPKVTFENTMIVAVFLGERPTAGYKPEITAVRLEGGTLVVEWQERTPSHAGNPPTVTTPFAVAGVPMHAGPVRFEKRVTR